jgi:hypothetical protein
MSYPSLKKRWKFVGRKRLRGYSTDDVWYPYNTGNLAATLQFALYIICALMCLSSNSTPCLHEFLSTFIHGQHLEKFAYIWHH